MTEKKKITKNQYLQLLGLQVIAERHTKALDEVEAAMYELVALDPEDCSAGDVIYGDRPIQWFLDRAGVVVEE